MIFTSDPFDYQRIAVEAGTMRRLGMSLRAIASTLAVDEKTVMAYLESQKWDQDDEGFKVTAPTEP